VKVTICDVGPRDGLQNEPEPLSVKVRAELVNRLAAVGVPRIEAVTAWLEETLGRELPGQVHRAWTLGPVAG
jgi:isopropylmalate/homocitrate/citramalate synthase